MTIFPPHPVRVSTATDDWPLTANQPLDYSELEILMLPPGVWCKIDVDLRRRQSEIWRANYEIRRRMGACE